MSKQAPVLPARRVVIIGGGIAGLSAALRVRTLDRSANIAVIDSGATLGGKIAGEIVDGCVVDGGADVCIGDKLRSTRMFDDLDLTARVIRVNPNKLPTFEWRDGRLQRVATGFSGELLTFRGGMREIVTIVCEALTDVAVFAGASAASVHRDATVLRVGCVDGRSHTADAVIIATPAPAAAALLSTVSPRSVAGLRALAYPATTTVTMAWNATDVPIPLNATGYLVADSEAPVSACTWTSAKNPTHATKDIALLRGYVRGVPDDPCALVRAAVAASLGISAAPLFTRVYAWDAGIPVYAPTHEQTVRNLAEDLQSARGLFIAGSAFHGVGIPDCILSGERAATAAMSYLLARQTEEAA